MLLDIHEICSFTDYFVIATGTSDRMLTALADCVKDMAKSQAQITNPVEGQSSEGWLLVDLGDVVVHLMSPDRREYYCLEQLWEKGKVLVSLK